MHLVYNNLAMRLFYNILYKVKGKDILISIKNKFKCTIKVLNLFVRDKEGDILFINLQLICKY
jgi:ABC-type uncharacterized transport system involved in gliding motility auxiliary subunit